MGLLEGKVAFITGGAQGQGRSHAVTQAREGADIVVTDILEPIPETLPYETSKPEHLDETVRLVEDLDRRCLSIKADARSSSDMNSAVDQEIGEFGKIDILSVNHGLTINVAWDVQTDEIWDATVENNLSACWRTARAVIPHMVENGGGAIVFTSSAAAQTAYASLSAYTAAKTGVIGLMRSLATELAPHWIRVNAILPGAVATQMLHSQSVIDMFTGKPGASVEEMAPPAQMPARSTSPPASHRRPRRGSASSRPGTPRRRRRARRRPPALSAEEPARRPRPRRPAAASDRFRFPRRRSARVGVWGWVIH